LAEYPDYWQVGIAHLSNNDAKLAALIAQYPNGILQSHNRPFYTLMRSITGQQISVQAADSIWGRLEAHVAEVTPDSCQKISEEYWRSFGYSRQKISYISNLINFTLSGDLQIEKLREMNDAELISHITQIKGIGKWSAEMFAIFCLLRPNILPLDDIGLQRAMAINYGIKSKPFDKIAALEIAEKWQPYCTIATWFLWRSIDPSEVHY
jgi:DNA-3-methyladenine glycosylase II